MDATFLNIAVPLVIGYLMDLVFGDPHWFPHPVKGFGWLIARGENILNIGERRFFKGFAMSIIFIGLTFVAIYYLQLLLLLVNSYSTWILNSILVYFCLANKSLIDEGKAVFKALEQSLEAGRKRLTWIVGRDTSNLTANQVRTAVFETMSENLSDGVIAPLFFYAIGGTPAMIAYKMASTLDSMIAYKSERYEQFGKSAARIDDILNFIPARITAILIAAVSMSKRSLSFIIKFGDKHASPNSGYPEAALAGVLDCRFGGPNVYHGLMVNKPYIGNNNRIIENQEIKRVATINHCATLVSVMCILITIFLIAH
ncbi:MAG TPA: adenosylcobinamide-phosphate synthase CbiB [Bacteroidales bacterium]|nr:adenosylcobinamide-phosphate synthase CbiB [Bacteroidales bacterium]